MRTEVPDQLLEIVDEIDDQGHASLTRLEVVTPWFEGAGRLPADQWPTFAEAPRFN